MVIAFYSNYIIYLIIYREKAVGTPSPPFWIVGDGTGVVGDEFRRWAPRRLRSGSWVMVRGSWVMSLGSGHGVASVLGRG
jgi:hypothetical protein